MSTQRVTLVGEIKAAEQFKFSPPLRDGSRDVAKQIIAAVADKPIGSGFEYVLEPDTKASSLRQALMGASADAGIGITTRFVGRSLFVFHMNKRPRRLKADSRGDEIAARRLTGDTLESIAVDLGITRERVRQIEKRHNFNSGPPMHRKAAVDAFVKPYLDAVPDEPTCIFCGALSDWMCKECRAVIANMRRAASCLRSFRRTGQRQSMANAMVIIRRNNFQPEDLKRG